jgi:two-component system CheB/CheR fusion protein
MPDKDGQSLVRELRADRSHALRSLSAIALTGLGRPEERLKSLRAGFQAQLCKPVDPLEFVALVGALARPAAGPGV